MQSDDPTVIRSLAIHTDDIVSALETNARTERRAVLRVTPPFNGRMRARLHLAGHESPYGDPAPIHIDPAVLVTDAAAFPDPDATEDRLRADADTEYTPERHREWHQQAVASWRVTVRDAIREELTLETPSGPHVVAVRTLG